MEPICRRTCQLLAATFVFLGALGSVAVADSEILAEARESWESRQAKTKSLQCSWRQESTGNYRWSTYRTADIPSGPMPPFSSRLDVHEYSILLETSRFCDEAHLEYAGYSPSGAQSNARDLNYSRFIESRYQERFREYVPARNYKLHFGRDRRLEFFGAVPGEPALAVADSVIRVAPLPIEVLDCLPLLVHYRPFSAACGADAAKWTLLPNKPRLSGAECDLVVESHPDAVERVYWIDRKRAAAVLRLIEKRNGVERLQVDVNYRDAGGGDVQPYKWSAILFPPRETLAQYPGRSDVFQFSAATLEECTINSRSDAPVVHLPVGCVIYDKAENRRSVVESDGSRRLITQAEWTHLLVHAKDANLSHWQHSRVKLLAGAAAGILLLSSIAVCRRLSGKRRDTGHAGGA